ncbi:MAG: sigma-70 family RNA polymerase sigma factor [Acidobacteria bacterium]|nr:sigma-70 family RNA polymerase sigma factor [Acidobacteriota bacterium]
MKQNLLLKNSQEIKKILLACQQGDQDAFYELFLVYKDRIYSLALHFSNNEGIVADITQTIFLKLFVKIKDFRFDSDFNTWLYRIVLNECIEIQRKEKRFLPFILDKMSKLISKDSHETKLIRKQAINEVQLVISTLDIKLRIPVILKYVEGLSYDEIAEIVGCSHGTIASRLNRAHKILARKLAHLETVLEELQ